MKQNLYSKKTIALVIFNGLFCITGLILIPAFHVNSQWTNIILGGFVCLDIIFYLYFILQSGKINKETRNLLALSLMVTVFPVVFHWIGSLIAR